MLKRSLFGFIVFATMCAGAVHAADKLTIGVSLADDTNPFYIGVKRGIQARAKQLGVDLAFVTANEVVAQQINGIQDLIEHNVDALLISPIDTKAVAGAYEMAGRAGIPVISVIRFANTPYEKRAVKMDGKAIGAEMGEWVANKTSGNGKVAMIAGPPGAELFRDLATGFKDAIGKHPGLTIVYQKDLLMTREVGLKQAEDILAAYPDITVLYCANDEVALGAAQAVAAAGKTGQIVITGLNGVPQAIKAVKDGSISFTYDTDGPNWGAVGLSTAVAYAQGKVPTDAEIAVHGKLVDRSNVDSVVQAASTH